MAERLHFPIPTRRTAGCRPVTLGGRRAHDLAGHARFRRLRKLREKVAYENSAMARDVIALIEHLRLDAVDVIGFSMGAATALRLLRLRPPQIKSAVLAGVEDYVIEETVMDFPKNWPVPDSVPRPITARVWLEEGAKSSRRGKWFRDTSRPPIS